MLYCNHFLIFAFETKSINFGVLISGIFVVFDSSNLIYSEYLSKAKLKSSIFRACD